MLNVHLVKFDDLTEDEQEFRNNDFITNYIKITHNNKTVMILSDNIEPEDASFTRDLKDVLPAIEKAYKLGVQDGQGQY